MSNEELESKAWEDDASFGRNLTEDFFTSPAAAPAQPEAEGEKAAVNELWMVWPPVQAKPEKDRRLPILWSVAALEVVGIVAASAWWAGLIG